MRSGIRADLRLERENLRAELRPEWSDFKLERAIMSPHRGYIPEKAYFGPEKANFMSE